MSRSPLLLACLLLYVPSLQATITFDLQGELLKNSSGVAIPTDSLVLLVSDTTGNGFANITDGSSLALNAFLNGGDDQVLARFDLSNSATAGTLFDFTAPLTLSGGWGVGDPLALLWFPTLKLADATASSGAQYGLFSGPALDGSNNWITPADGASGYKLWFYNADAVSLPDPPPGSHAGGLGNASLTVAGVIPEPSRSLLALIGIAGVAFRRRR